MPRKRRVVDHIVEHRAAIGIDHFHPGITAVLAKHEFSAATMADGYSRSGAGRGPGPGTGLGLVAATSGGAAHDFYSDNRFRSSRLSAGLAAMFPGLTSVDVTDLDGFVTAMRAALDVDGSAVVSVECADKIPPFAPFLTGTPAKTTAAPQIPTAKENRTDVAASA